MNNRTLAIGLIIALAVALFMVFLWREVIIDPSRPFVISNNSDIPTPTPTPHPNAYRYMIPIPTDNDTNTGMADGNANPEYLGDGDYSWVNPNTFTGGAIVNESSATLIIPGCVDHVMEKHRYLYAYREDLGDLTEFYFNGAFNQVNVWAKVSTFTVLAANNTGTENIDYVVYATRPRLLCSEYTGVTASYEQ